MKNIPIQKIKQLLHERKFTDDELFMLRADPRKGVQRLLATYDKQIEKERMKRAAFEQKINFDLQYKREQDWVIAGVDEAGRGPLAGPVVSAAVILPDNFTCLNLDDSKKLTENEREKLYEKIIREAKAYAISIIDNETIDEVNIYEATKISMSEALEKLSIRPNIALIDAVQLNIPHIPTTAIVKGDAKSLHIAAASILAKVTRDRLMDEIAQNFPMYDFTNNNGYGTKIHLDALKKYGPCKYHRFTFAPVSEMRRSNH